MKKNRAKLDGSTRTLITILVSLLVFVISTVVILLLQEKTNSSAKNESVPSNSAVAASTVPSVAPLASVEPILQPVSDSNNYVPISIDNNTGFKSGWSTITTDGNVTSTLTYNQDILNILSPGSDINAIGFYRDGIPFINGSSYTISLSVVSSISRSIQLEILNADTGETFSKQTYSIGPDSQNLSLQFKMAGSSTFNGRLMIAIGNDSSSEIQNIHTITIDQLRINSSTDQHGVAVNQVGYSLNSEKRCTFTYDAGDFFDVIDVSTGSIVYTGAVIDRAYSDSTGQTNSYGDFTNIVTPGKYRVRTQIGVTSYEFEIGDAVYANLSVSLLKTIALQRCGQNLDSSWAGSLAHPSCHTQQATIEGTTETLDVTGGWHDAGDFGRYIKTGSKAVNDLLMTYLLKPNAYDDNTGTGDSSNGVSDVLDEAKIELNWMLKMQDSSDGGVYSKVLTPNVAGIITPDQDTQQLYVLGKETTSTADFCGTMALASITFDQIDNEFSNTCLDAAKKAYSYLNDHTELEEVTNPQGINGGEYRDDSDQDGRFFSSIALWCATSDQTYLDSAKTILSSHPEAANGVGWQDNGAYGKYLFLMQQNAETADSSLYGTLLDSLKQEAQQILDIVNGSGYNCSLTSFVWGSNGFAANNGILLSMTADVTGDEEYRQAAIEQIDYLLGRNSVDICFVSGYGTYSPQNIHSRIAKANNTKITGALVGGPNSSREDTATQALSPDLPEARIYVDDYNSYSTNELSIYWNAALIHLIASIEN